MTHTHRFHAGDRLLAQVDHLIEMLSDSRHPGGRRNQQQTHRMREQLQGLNRMQAALLERAVQNAESYSKRTDQPPMGWRVSPLDFPALLPRQQIH